MPRNTGMAAPVSSSVWFGADTLGPLMLKVMVLDSGPLRDRADLVDDGRPERAGQGAVAHAGVSDQPGTGDGSRRRPAADGVPDLVGLAVQDQRGDAYAGKLLAAVARGQQRRLLAEPAGGIVA